jgi:predicted unusual protein kinase regulating ubiquinone biosynthesis (AarF/ABC1/UbiB family)
MKQATLRAMKRQRTLRLAKLLSRAFYLRRRGRKSEMYNLICDEMVSLGGVYVKFLQGVMLNGKVMKQWTNPNRLKIFESLDTEPLDIVQILRAELSADQLANITLVQPEPFAAGSFGQVYFAQHKNGRQIHKFVSYCAMTFACSESSLNGSVPASIKISR